MHTQTETKPDLCSTSCNMKEAILPGLAQRLEEIGSRGLWSLISLISAPLPDTKLTWTVSDRPGRQPTNQSHRKRVVMGSAGASSRRRTKTVAAVGEILKSSRVAFADDVHLRVKLLRKDQVGRRARDRDETSYRGGVGDAERQAFADHVIPLGGILGVSPGLHPLHVWDFNGHLRKNVNEDKMLPVLNGNNKARRVCCCFISHISSFKLI